MASQDQSTTADAAQKTAPREQIEIVTAMLDRLDAAKGRGGYPSSVERWAMRELLNWIKQ